MARQIKETPVLKGKDARRFEKKIAENKKDSRKVSPDKYRRALKTYSQITIQN